jgi:hypothetical protein
MGYTHYWRGGAPFSDDEWRQIKVATSTILDWCQDQGVDFRFENDGPEPAIVEDRIIMFNGAEMGTTFVLRRQPSMFACCKTQRDPYDLAVGLVLVAVAQIAPDSLDISSDGSWQSDWREIRESYAEIFGLEPECILDEGDDS